MVDQRLLSIFLAVTSVAVLIQTGIVVGLYFATAKMSHQAERALDITHSLVEPLHRTLGNLQTVTERVATFSSTAQGQLRHFEDWWKRRTA